MKERDAGIRGAAVFDRRYSIHFLSLWAVIVYRAAQINPSTRLFAYFIFYLSIFISPLKKGKNTRYGCFCLTFVDSLRKTKRSKFLDMRVFFYHYPH